MIKEKMIRNLSNLMMAIIIALSIFLCVTALPETGFSGWEIVHKPTDYPTSVDPYEVIVYEHANFVGEYIRFKLEPGMRQKLVPDLKEMNDRISSIQVGSKVAVMVFMDANYGVGGPYTTLHDSQKVLDETINDSISSLIVFPKEWAYPIGVMLSDHRAFGFYYQFYPLPEALNQTEARYHTLGGMNDNANEIQLYPFGSGSPMYGKVQVTLYEQDNFKGRWITLPGADGSIPSLATFELNHYQFDDTASSLVVRWTGPSQAPQTQVPPPSSTPAGSSSTRAVAPESSSSTRVAAPPASGTTQPSSDRTPPPPSSVTTTTPSDKTSPPPSSGVTITNISGQWKSNIGLIYNITQQGSQFKWAVLNSDEIAEGTITGNNVSASWKSQKGSGSSSGKITNGDSHGKATEIKWENGVRFYR